VSKSRGIDLTDDFVNDVGLVFRDQIDRHRAPLERPLLKLLFIANQQRTFPKIFRRSIHDAASIFSAVN
ncbi:MAG: hypothetical protein RLY14_2201, partial [Planctomycetota bacterium]|jgi:hypothetical protein